MAVNFSLTALTGINSASTGLGVISNNISNAQTLGFKSSRAEFADLFYGSQNSPGTGSRTQVVHQNFNQGAINDTGNQLDLALNGEGLFILEDKTGRYDSVYTRNGSFKLDKDGFVTDQVGNKLQGFAKDINLSATAGIDVYTTILGSLNIGNLNKVPKSTSQTTFDLNLNGQDPVTYTTTASGGHQSGSGVPFTANNLKDLSYDGAPNYSTSKVVYDSLGGEHRMTVNYYKSSINAPGTYPTKVKASDNKIAYSNETTDWYAQYIMEDYDKSTGTWYKSGSGQDSAQNATNNQSAMDAGQAVRAIVGTSQANVDTALNAATSFGVPVSAADAGLSAYNLASALGASAARATEAKNAASAAFTGATPEKSAFDAVFGAAGTLETAGVFAAPQGAANTSAYNSYQAKPWGAESGRLVSLFTITNAAGVTGLPTNSADAARAAQNAALALGINASQAAQAAEAAQRAFAVVAPPPPAPPATPAVLAAAAEAAFTAAFGKTVTEESGVVTAIPDAVVQAYRFDSAGKLLDFDNSGNFANISGNTVPPTTVIAPQRWYFDVPNLNGTVGVTEAMTFTAELTKLTQYAGTYNIRGVTQDGYAAGDLVGVQVNKDGSVEAQYSNGRSDTVAKLALANFSDQQGLQKLGSQMWAETAASGPRQLGNAQASGFGAIQSGALEYSNTDVTGELVNMIFMQKMYQASAQVISTDKTLTQTILQL